MHTRLHSDAVLREELIARYLAKKLDPPGVESFEDHYLACEDCFEEVRAAELLIYGLGEPSIQRTRRDDVTVVRFAHSAELTGTSVDLGELVRVLRSPGDTKVVIDLSKVSRIDSLGLGMLMNCYAHAVRNEGMLKLLNPTAQVKGILSITRIDSVLPLFDDEDAAVRSFHEQGQTAV